MGGFSYSNLPYRLEASTCPNNLFCIYFLSFLNMTTLAFMISRSSSPTCVCVWCLQKVLLRQSNQVHNPSLLSRGRQLQAPRGAQQGDAAGLKHVLYSR